ncbi:MAG: hydroxyisourate hydrolase [Beijerinckiaceae bacterium]
MGRLSTHVLDTANGMPARGMALTLDVIEQGKLRRLATTRTNQDGRTDAPLLTGGALKPGTYVLTFQVRDYFRGVMSEDSPFLDEVPIRFVVADAAAHYHVPLLCTPWSYSTYRGS